MVPNTPRYFTAGPLPAAAEALASPWICAGEKIMKIQLNKMSRMCTCKKRIWYPTASQLEIFSLFFFFTCSRTLAVSRGKVSRSAIQAAVPAPTNFTAADGGTSAGPNPTIFQDDFRSMCGLKCGRWMWAEQEAPPISEEKTDPEHVSSKYSCVSHENLCKSSFYFKLYFPFFLLDYMSCVCISA